MEQLTAEYIAPYLPYALQCQITDNGKTEIAELQALYVDGSCVFFDVVESEKGFDEVRPILKSMSKLTEQELEAAMFSSHKDWLTIERSSWITRYGRVKWLNNIPVGHMNYLLKNHFDVFDLIGKRLAIEKK